MVIVKTHDNAKFRLEPPQYEHKVIWDEELCYYEHSPSRGNIPKKIGTRLPGSNFEVTPRMIFDDAIRRLQDSLRTHPKEKCWQVPICLTLTADELSWIDVEFGLLDMKKEKDEYRLTVATRDPSFCIPPEKKAFIPLISVTSAQLDDKFWKKAYLAMAIAYFGINFHYYIGKLDF